MSTAYSAHMFRSAVGVFAAMLHIYKTAEVSATFPVPVRLRCAAAFCTSVGVVIGGGRLMPVTGKQGLQHMQGCMSDRQSTRMLLRHSVTERLRHTFALLGPSHHLWTAAYSQHSKVVQAYTSTW